MNSLNQLISKCLPLLRMLFLFISFIYFGISFAYFGLLKGPEGDELGFIADLSMVQTQGWTAAIKHGISLPYTILAYPFTFLCSNFAALRLTSIVLTALLFFYFFRIAKIKSADFYAYLMFFMATSSYFFTGIDDVLFICSMIVFLAEVFFFLEHGKMNHVSLAFAGLVVSVFARELFAVYIPAVLLAFYFLYRGGFAFFSKKMIIPAVLFLLLVGVNLPSLIANHRISYATKAPQGNVTWSQYQYHAQLLVNEGKLQYQQHQSWDDTKKYLAEHGENSLPKTTFQSIIFDYKLTISEFFVDFYYCLLYGFRQLGLLLFFLIFVLGIGIFKKATPVKDLYAPLVTIGMTATFSFIIISFVELRWLIAAFVLGIIYFCHKLSQHKINVIVALSHYGILSLLSIYGLMRLWPKIADLGIL